MNKQTVIDLVSPRMKLIRTEMDYTQDEMADIIGISKKTLVQLEKGRQELGWAVAVVVCALFRESALLRSVMGDDPVELAEIAVHAEIHSRETAASASVNWWIEVGQWQQYKLQQHTAGGHYRIIGEGGKRLFSTGDREKALAQFKKYMDIM
ncbi:transcriptional regulator [Sporosarcina sp. P37]|uniref:helix-turn-helix transcriptional regulator n=1 Tax=unclassified Sporosarcina TaxID=2647733 RepID=UPI000A17BC66|nr:MULTISPECIES: helix-turn-helix domain-containing protein [unclassified Sporosarcina]ARK23413.1 transcriptional regulator [Sporosarcina sp. P37]PID18623.1 helix-turn-helix domain-containing protein [Sporosarcina sp. P35]